MLLRRKPLAAASVSAPPSVVPDDITNTLIPGKQNPFLPVFEAIASETQMAALLSATTTSVINATGNMRESETLAALKEYRPSAQSQLPSLRGWLVEADIDASRVDSAVAWFRGLASARQLLDAFFSDADSLGAARAVILHRTELGNTWRWVCSQAITAIEDIDRALGEQLNQLYRESKAVLVPILQQAGDGGSPCIDENGKVFLPMLPQRRRAARHMLLQECQLQVRRRTVKAVIRDVASGGFGIIKIEGEIARNDIAVIELQNGRRFIGSVAWAKGRSAGIKLTKPLSLTDPLVAG